MNANELIEKLGLRPLPGEGGFYKETYRASETISRAALPIRYGTDKCMATAIYYFLTSETFSAMHRLPSDEVYHFYLGDPVTMLQLHPDGSETMVTMGTDLFAGQVPQCVVARNVWQGSMLRAGGQFALLGTTMSPGFDFADLELGSRKELLTQYTRHTDLIMRLTRES